MWKRSSDTVEISKLWNRKYKLLYNKNGIVVDYMTKDRLKHFCGSIVASNCADSINANLYVYTMLDKCDLTHLAMLCEEVIKNNITGDFLEAGVWRGGSCIMMKHVVNKLKSDKKMYLLDSFESMNKFETINNCDNVNDNNLGDKMDCFITDFLRDVSLYYKQRYNENFQLVKGVSIDEIKHNFFKFNLLDDNIIFVKGWIDDQFVKNLFIHDMNENEKQFSIIRIDLDLYKPTKYILKYLYKRLTIGGYIIFDEYFIDIMGEKLAVDQFRKENNIKEEISRTGDAKTQRIGYWKKKYQI